MDAGGQLEIDSVIMTLTALIKVAIAQKIKKRIKKRHIGDPSM